jgi:hypothetical protein
VRIKKNPRFYAIANGAATSPDARLEEIVVESVKALVSEGIVDESDGMISPTSEQRYVLAVKSSADRAFPSNTAYGDVCRLPLAPPKVSLTLSSILTDDGAELSLTSYLRIYQEPPYQAQHAHSARDDRGSERVLELALQARRQGTSGQGQQGL